MDCWSGGVLAWFNPVDLSCIGWCSLANATHRVQVEQYGLFHYSFNSSATYKTKTFQATPSLAVKRGVSGSDELCCALCHQSSTLPGLAKYGNGHTMAVIDTSHVRKSMIYVWQSRGNP
eukprot:4705023-Amphidinium_carterae.3